MMNAVMLSVVAPFTNHSALIIIENAIMLIDSKIYDKHRLGKQTVLCCDILELP
jgi:hypothetical protein